MGKREGWIVSLKVVHISQMQSYNRDELHYETVQLALQSYAYNQSSFEKAQDHTC